VEKDIGTIRFILVYFPSGIMGFILGANFAGNGVASTGCSGPLFGIIALVLLVQSHQLGVMLIRLGSRIQLEQLPTPKTTTCDTPNTSHSVFCPRSPARSRQLLALRWIRNRPPIRHRSYACPTTNQSPYLTRSLLCLRSRCTILFSHRKRNAHNISHNRLQGYTRILSGS